MLKISSKEVQNVDRLIFVFESRQSQELSHGIGIQSEIVWKMTLILRFHRDWNYDSSRDLAAAKRDRSLGIRKIKFVKAIDFSRSKSNGSC